MAKTVLVTLKMAQHYKVVIIGSEKKIIGCLDRTATDYLHVLQTSCIAYVIKNFVAVPAVPNILL